MELNLSLNSNFNGDSLDNVCSFHLRVAFKLAFGKASLAYSGLGMQVEEAVTNNIPDVPLIGPKTHIAMSNMGKAVII